MVLHAEHAIMETMGNYKTNISIQTNLFKW